MSYIRDTDFVDIPPPSIDNPPNPLLGYNGGGTAPPSEVTSTASVSLRHRLLLYDQRCLVTGAVSNQLQACHLVNTIRVDKAKSQETKEQKIALKEAVVGSQPLFASRRCWNLLT